MDTKGKDMPSASAGNSINPVKSPSASPKKRFSLGGDKRLPLIAGAAVLLIGASAYGYFGIYQQSPSVVWNAAMSKTADALEAFSEASQSVHKDGGKLTGSFRLEKPAAMDGSVNSQFYKGNSITKLDVGFVGTRLNAEARTIQTEGAKSPDLYLNATGLNSLAALMSLGGETEYSSLLSQIEGKWYVLDHTMFDQIAQQPQQGTGLQFSSDDIKDIQNKVVAVVNGYLFTSDESKAVLTKGRFIGKEDFEGTASFRYENVVNKDKFREFVVALKDALKTTKVKDMVGADEQSFEEAIQFESILKGVDRMDFSKVKVETWVAKGTKLIRNVRFTPAEQADGETGYVDVGLDYKGGDEVPLKIAIVGSDNQSKGHVTATLKVNRKTLVSEVGIQLDVDNSDEAMPDLLGQASFKFEPSDDQVEVSKPEGAVNLMELLGNLLGGFIQPTGQLPEGFDLSDLPAEEL